MEDYVFTFCFGSDHQHHGKFVRISGSDYGDAKAKMVKLFGTDWAFQYKASNYAKVMSELPLCFRETELILTSEQMKQIES